MYDVCWKLASNHHCITEMFLADENNFMYLLSETLLILNEFINKSVYIIYL